MYSCVGRPGEERIEQVVYLEMIEVYAAVFSCFAMLP
jgi:hypothetical protein